MKKLLAVIFLGLVLYGLWWFFFSSHGSASTEKTTAMEIKKHSGIFNQSVAAAMNNYFNLKSAFVDADTVKIKSGTIQFIASVDSIKIDELKKDTTTIFETVQSQLSDIKANANALLPESDLTEMRQDFRMISENLYPLLKTIKYEGEPLYWQNCPMAFGEGKEANWISNTRDIINPYLGKNHPEFKGSMLHCGEIKDTIK
ncbi:MAG: DUF3347 domain-containing protein [Ginsengibacter sp.]